MNQDRGDKGNAVLRARALSVGGRAAPQDSSRCMKNMRAFGISNSKAERAGSRGTEGRGN